MTLRALYPAQVPIDDSCEAINHPLAVFGSLLMTAQYHCNACNTTFEWVRREDVEPQ